MAKSTWKQWTVEEKLKILNFCDEHSAVKAAQKFNISKSVIYKWKTDLKKGGIPALEWDQSTKAYKKSKKTLQNKSWKQQIWNYVSWRVNWKSKTRWCSKKAWDSINKK